MSSAQVFFAEVWPSMSRRVSRHLGHVGVPAQDREDVLQEAALRLYRSWSVLETGRPVEPFVRTVAVNVWRDRWRHSRDREVLADQLPEPRAAAEVVEDTVVARLELRRVSRALRQLRPTQQQLILGAMQQELAPDSNAPVPAVMRMARMRARRSLVGCLQSASAVVAALVIWVRRLSAQASAAVPTALAGMVLFVGLAVLTQGGGGSGPTVKPDAGSPAGAAGVITIRPVDITRPPQALGHLAGHALRPPTAATAVKPLVVDTGVAQAGAIVEVRLGSTGARVSGGESHPACVFGVGPASQAGLACSR